MTTIDFRNTNVGMILMALKSRGWRTVGGIGRETGLPLELVATILKSHPEVFSKSPISPGGEDLFSYKINAPIKESLTESGDKYEKAGVLARDKEYVKFVQLLRKAEKEGRLDGTFSCTLCGMRYNTQQEAEECCRITVT